MKLWSRRRLVAEAIALLPLARLLVRFVKIGRWKHTLGASLSGAANQLGAAERLEIASQIGRSVERASWRMGGGTKCLPKAIVAMWMLRRRGIAARLVIASVCKTQEHNADPLHAWVELQSTMIIGHCDRTLYHPLASFGEQPDLPMRPESLSREAS